MDEKIKKLYQEFSQDINLSEEAQKRVKDKIFQRLSEIPDEVRPSFWQLVTNVMLKAFVLVPLVVVLFIAGTAFASNNSLPGDLFYPVKRQVESVRVFLAPTAQKKLDLQVNFTKKRLQELEKVEQDASQTKNQPISKTGSDKKENQTRAEAQHAIDVLIQVENNRHKDDEANKELSKTIKLFQERLRKNRSHSDQGNDLPTEKFDTEP